ncbi:gp53-like domain-containing protein [Enterobacter hormaechei]|uniref:gp53-like domain-containing protein n=1 Tax=Enterobacter hormaechei TaxID=158836 RepID=UPI003CF475F0
MGLFAANFAGGANSYAKFPNGLIIQTGAITSIPAGTSIEVFYPIAFSNSNVFRDFYRGADRQIRPCRSLSG